MRKPWLVAVENMDKSVPNSVLFEDPIDSLEAHLLEVQAEAHTTEQLINQAGDLSDDLSILADMEQGIRESPSDTGVSESTAAILDVAIESFCKRWDIPITKPGAESQIGLWGESRKQIALEGIGSTIAAGFAKFIAFIKSLIEKVGNKLKAIRTKSTQFEKRIKILRTAIDAAADKPSKKMGLLGTQLIIDGKCNPAGIIDFIAKIEVHAKPAFETVKQWSEDVLAKKKPSVNKIDLGVPAQSVVAKRAVDDYHGTSASALPNNVCIVTYEDDQCLKVVKVRLEDVDAETMSGNKAELHKALDAVESTVRITNDIIDPLYKEYLTQLRKLTTMRDVFEPAADSTSAPPKEYRTLSTTISGQNILMDALSASIEDAGIGLIEYVRRSLLEIGKKHENS